MPKALEVGRPSGCAARCRRIREQQGTLEAGVPVDPWAGWVEQEPCGLVCRQRRLSV